MTKKPTRTTSIPATAAAKPRPLNLVYDHAVRLTLERGRRQEIAELLSAAKRLKVEYGDLDGLISTLESAARNAR
jgi:hypothetical protein